MHHHLARFRRHVPITVAFLGLMGPCSAAEPAAEAPPMSASAISSPLPLFDGQDLGSWWISPKSPVPTIEHGELVIQSRMDAPFHAEVGGMSWDDYEVAGEFRTERLPSAGMVWNLQFCPANGLIFGQLLGGNVTKIAYVDIAGNRAFSEVRQNGVPRPAHVGEWHRFSILASGGVVATRVDDCATTSAIVPAGTRGMFALLVNFGNNGSMRLRHLTIAFLKPTTIQLQEYARPAAKNWETWMAADPAHWDAWAAGRRAASLDPDDPSQWIGKRPASIRSTSPPSSAARPTAGF